jgi:HD-GYP domain-containing protein (c-di-GMP phosphodiesterase class II)
MRDDLNDNSEELNLREIGHALISVLDLEKLFPLVNNLTINGTGSLTGIVALIIGDEVHVKASMGQPSFVVKNVPFKIGEDPIGWVAKNGESIVVSDIDKDKRFNKQQFRLYFGKTLLCVPIKAQDRIIGVIIVNKRLGEIYTHNDVQFLETIASYISVAIKDSDLYAKLKSSNKIDQLAIDYYDKNNKYLPVTLRSIKTGAFSECDLYLQTVVNDEFKYLLYCKGSRLFGDERKESFIKKNINKIYVAKNGKAQYLRYMEANLEQIVNDEMTAMHEKVQIVYEVATNMLIDTLKGSNISVTVERGRDWATVVVDFMLRDKEFYSHLIKVLAYDGNVLSHSVNTAVMGLLFGYYLGISASELLSLGTGLLFHDIGKIRIDEHTIKKDYEKLTKEERELLRKHPDMGFVLLVNSGNVAREACLIAKQHHEQYNGKGYPEGLKGEEIHYYSRITSILDEFETGLSKTTDNDVNSAFRVLQIMVERMEGNFDKEILKKFIDFMRFSTVEELSVVEHKDISESVR